MLRAINEGLVLKHEALSEYAGSGFSLEPEVRAMDRTVVQLNY